MSIPFSTLRIAHGSVTYPANTAANTASTLSANVVGAHIPKGAIVTRIWVRPGTAVTNISAMKNGTINFVVSPGGAISAGQAIGTNNRVASSLLSVASAAVSQAVVAASGGNVTVGGQLIANFASSDSDRSGISGNFDAYVEYLYAADVDIT